MRQIIATGWTGCCTNVVHVCNCAASFVAAVVRYARTIFNMNMTIYCLFWRKPIQDCRVTNPASRRTGGRRAWPNFEKSQLTSICFGWQRVAQVTGQRMQSEFVCERCIKEQLVQHKEILNKQAVINYITLSSKTTQILFGRTGDSYMPKIKVTLRQW